MNHGISLPRFFHLILLASVRSPGVPSINYLGPAHQGSMSQTLKNRFVFRFNILALTKSTITGFQDGLLIVYLLGNHNIKLHLGSSGGVKSNAQSYAQVLFFLTRTRIFSFLPMVSRAPWESAIGGIPKRRWVDGLAHSYLASSPESSPTRSSRDFGKVGCLTFLGIETCAFNI